MSRRQSWVTGLAAATALGSSVLDTCASCLAGVSRFTHHPRLVDDAGEAVQVAALAPPRRDSAPDERLAELALAALQAADPGWRSAPLLTLGLPDPKASHLDEELGGGGAPARRELFNGPASGGLALARAHQALCGGETDRALAAAVSLVPEDGELRRRMAAGEVLTSQNPWGTVPADAAGVCALAADPPATPPLARIRAVGVGRVTDPDAPRVGRGLCEAWQGALAGLDPGERVDELWVDMAGRPTDADELGFALVNLGGALRDPARARTPATHLGDTGPAAAPLLLGLAVHAHRRGMTAGPLALVCCCGGGGPARLAILLECVARDEDPLAALNRSWTWPA